MTTHDRELFIETFRTAVLRAFDRTARGMFQCKHGDAGAADADLPALFKAIDTQAEKLAARYGVTLVQSWPPGRL